MRATVACLPVGQREVVILVDLEECRYAEVAPSAVRFVVDRLKKGWTYVAI